MNFPTTERLHEALDYNPDTGVFTWKIARKGTFKGSIAGFVRPDKYRIICLDGARFRANRLAWFYMTSKIPLYDIDHKDGNPENNAFFNLRDVTTAQNIQNQNKPHKRNKSGFFGVSWHKAGKCWRARICTDGVQKVLGYFDTPEEAHKAYLEAKRILHLACTIQQFQC